MPSLQNGHCSNRRNSQGADVYNEADTDAVSKVEADIEVEREYGIRYGREAGKDNGEGCKSEDGGYDTVSDVVESKVHQCQQNSDA